MTDLSSTRHAAPSRRRLPLVLLAAFAIIWALLAIAPSYRQDWLLENVLVFIALPLLVLGHRRTPLSNPSYVLVFIFLVLHEIGAHFTYSEVPYDAWWQSLTGFSLNAALGWDRNHYDRLLHLLFGLLITAPLRELLMRRSGLRGRWSYVLPVVVAMAASLSYELIEWSAALVFGGDLGIAYVGTQGDVWDAHKDMACAAFAAVFVMLLRASVDALRPRGGMKILAPVRATRRYTQHLAGSVAEVFPLLCPVREADWIEDWNPLRVVSASGVAEPDCVFTTAARPANAIWYITQHETEAGFVEMLKIAPGVTACRISIQLRPAAGGCEADVTYTHTSLGPAGDAFVASFTEDYYRGFMQQWEAQLNHYLRHGTALPATNA